MQSLPPRGEPCCPSTSPTRRRRSWPCSIAVPRRNAIVACWIGLHAATVRAGLPEVASETSEEYLVRAVRSLGLDPPAITVLASLYREARFSEHVMVEGQRDLAEQSLRLLVDQLVARRTESASNRLLEGAAR